VKQVVIPRYGPPEVLEVREAPDPHAGPGTVRIRVAAAGVNFSDLLARQGLYPDAPKPPLVVGYEVAGEVDEVGEGVTAFREGDRVFAMVRFWGQSELFVAPVDFVRPLPPSWSFQEGAGLPVCYLTAHHMLVRIAACQRGETVLVHAAAGGVGLAVAELGKILGLRLIGLASASKHAVLREHGVEPLDGRDPRWWEAVKRVSPRGVDVVLDAVGGDSWRQGYRLLVPGGRLVCFGVSTLVAGPTRNMVRALWEFIRFPRWGAIDLMNRNRSVAGVNVGHLWNERQLMLPQIDALLTYANAGKIRPRIDKAFPFSQAADAHRYIHERKNIGKVVLTP